MSRQWMVFILCCVMLQTGCKSLSLVKDSSKSDASTNQTMQSNRTAKQAPTIAPARMAVIWKENYLRVPGKSPVRGFTGRIYFHDLNDQLIKVDGQLSVYAYDDSNARGDSIADRNYVFPAEQFPSHYSPSELGHAYTVWVPWGPKEGFRKSITLIPVFKTTDNQIIQGTANRLALSGKIPPEATIQKTIVPSPGSHAAHQHSLTAANGRPQVETIPVPRQLAQKMHAVPQNRLPPDDLRLAELDNPEINPNGELYNRMHVQQSVSPAPGYPNIPVQTGQVARQRVPQGQQGDVAQAHQVEQHNAQENTIAQTNFQQVTDRTPSYPGRFQRRHSASQPNRSVFGSPGAIHR